MFELQVAPAVRPSAVAVDPGVLDGVSMKLTVPDRVSAWF
jgi:hypothetical protein